MLVNEKVRFEPTFHCKKHYTTESTVLEESFKLHLLYVPLVCSIRLIDLIRRKYLYFEKLLCRRFISPCKELMHYIQQYSPLYHNVLLANHPHEHFNFYSQQLQQCVGQLSLFGNHQEAFSDKFLVMELSFLSFCEERIYACACVDEELSWDQESQ